MIKHKPDTLPTPVVETPTDAARAAAGVETYRKKLGPDEIKALHSATAGVETYRKKLGPDEIKALQSAAGPLGKVTEALRLRLTDVIENARQTDRDEP